VAAGEPAMVFPSTRGTRHGYPSTDAPVSPLRQRMQHDMLMRGLGSHTRQDYVRHVRCFAAFLGHSPDTINGTVSALWFLFLVTLQRRDLSRALVITCYHRKLPDVLSVEEAGRLLEAVSDLKYSRAFSSSRAFRRRVSDTSIPPNFALNL
jgi:integrase/recombinase XerD